MQRNAIQKVAFYYLKVRSVLLRLPYRLAEFGITLKLVKLSKMCLEESHMKSA
jgi:hypothetical protein